MEQSLPSAPGLLLPPDASAGEFFKTRDRDAFAHTGALDAHSTLLPMPHDDDEGLESLASGRMHDVGHSQYDDDAGSDDQAAASEAEETAHAHNDGVAYDDSDQDDDEESVAAQSHASRSHVVHRGSIPPGHGQEQQPFGSPRATRRLGALDALDKAQAALPSPTSAAISGLSVGTDLREMRDAVRRYIQEDRAAAGSPPTRHQTSSHSIPPALNFDQSV